MSTSKVRVYEVAKELGIPNKDLVGKIRALGINVSNHMSNLDVSEADRVRQSLKSEQKTAVVEERLSATVIRRRSRRDKTTSSSTTDTAPGSSAKPGGLGSQVSAKPAAAAERQGQPAGSAVVRRPTNADAAGSTAGSRTGTSTVSNGSKAPASGVVVRRAPAEAPVAAATAASAQKSTESRRPRAVLRNPPHQSRPACLPAHLPR